MAPERLGAAWLLFIAVSGVASQNCDFSDLHISDCHWQASQSADASPSLRWQVFDEGTLGPDSDSDDFQPLSRSPSSLLTKYALLRFGVLFNATHGSATLISTSVSPFLRCLTFWYRANASPYTGAIVAPNPSSAHTAPWPTFRLKLIGGNEGPGVETDTTLLYTLPLQPGSTDGDRWQFRELSIPAVKSHYRVMLEVEVPRRVVAGYVAIDNVAFQARCDAGLHSSYTMWPGNCRGNFVMDWGEPAGCRRCSLEECAVMCDSFSNCDGFSYSTGAASGSILIDYPENYQCYLKQGSCSTPVKELPYSYFAKSGRHGDVTPQTVVAPEPTPQAAQAPGYRGEGDSERFQGWQQWSRPTTRLQRWHVTTQKESTTARPEPPPVVSLPGPPPQQGVYIIPAMFDDRYEQLDGNCGGNFLFRNGLRVGCQGCSLEECKQLCSKFELTDSYATDSSLSREHYGSRCLGFSFTGRTDVEPRCLLKSMNYCVPSYNTLGYFFYRKVMEPGRVVHEAKRLDDELVLDDYSNSTKL